MKILWLAIIGLLFLPDAYGEIIVGDMGTIISDPTDMTVADFNKDGVPDTVVIGAGSKAIAVGTYSWTKDVQSVEAVVAVDLDSNGYMDEVVAVGRDIVAFDSSGSELWRADTSRGYSGVSVDLDNDGHKNEVVAGCWNRISAFDSEGNSLWNYTEINGNVKAIALTENFVVGGAGRTIYAVDFDGKLRWGKAVSNPVLGITAVDFSGDGSPDGVVVLTYGDSTANIEAYTMYGADKGWSIGGQVHENTVNTFILSVDKQSKGTQNYALFNLDFGVYWISTAGSIQQKLSINFPSALNKIDLDGDGILDDTILGTRSSDTSSGKLYVYNALGQKVGESNASGANIVAAIDLDSDGKVDDAIAVSNFEKRIISITTQFSDTTTSTAPATTAPPATTAAPATTAPPATTAAPSDTDGISVELGPDLNVTEGVEVTLTATATPGTSGGSIVNYLWIESDQVLGTGNPLKEVFESGSHEVKVVITDNTGATAEDTVKIAVAGAADSAGDSDSDGWLDALEAQMGTDPNNPDTDGDGILDGEDPNPLVADSSGSIMDKIPSGLITIVKWIVIIGGGIIAIIFIREKILDFLWERNQEWGEG